MTNKFKISVLLLLSWYLLTDCSAVKNRTPINNEDLSITLRWVKSYPQETQEKVEIGLKWILSYLGAMLPQETSDETMIWLEEDVMTLNIGKAGFPTASHNHWKLLLKQLRQTQEYTRFASLDIGRFVMMSFNSSENYYAITGVYSTYSDFKSSFEFNAQNQESLLPGQSGVTSGLRKVYYSTTETIDQIAHIAEEGTGNDPQSFEAKEFEVFDFMPNGQPRFAIYGIEGYLLVGGSPELSRAGKPAKCMWCHESKVQLPFRVMREYADQPELFRRFKSLVKQQNTVINQYYMDMIETVDTFKIDKRKHYLAELLYLTYQNPTMERATRELLNSGQSIQDFSPVLEDSVHHEFSYLKELMSRKELDGYLPYKSDIEIDAREANLVEKQRFKSQ